MGLDWVPAVGRPLPGTNTRGAVGMAVQGRIAVHLEVCRMAPIVSLPTSALQAVLKRPPAFTPAPLAGVRSG